MIDPAIVLLLSACAAALFASAALHKFIALRAFQAALLAYDILPVRAVAIAGCIVPLGELLIASVLCSSALRSQALLAAAFMLVGYGLAISVNLRRGRRFIDCGCVGFAERRSIAPWMVARNLLFALVLVGCAVIPWSARNLRGTDAVTIIGGLVSIACLYLAAEELLGRVPRAAGLMPQGPQ